MASSSVSVSEADQTACVVCCHETKIWAVGECNHPTCLLCCARLRVLCEQKDCPVCRLHLKLVVVDSKLSPFQDIPYQDWRQVDRRYQIHFRNRGLHEAFRSMLDYKCQLCPTLWPFRNFRKLREHVSKAHDLHFCDICVDNLKLFPSEFKMYTRAKLTVHRREGDSEDTSYRGHPNCEFCSERYLDNDALHMHLRKQHYWCHFCENDGKQDFFPDVRSLRMHFMDDHFLCEEGECRHNVLTAAFRNEIDLAAHRASAHSRGLSKAEAKKMRHLPIEFMVQAGGSGGGEEAGPVGGGRRRTVPVRGGGGGGGGGGHFRDVRSAQMSEREEREVAMAVSASLQHQQQQQQQQQGSSEHKNKSSKRHPPGRKKTLCAQKDPEPPPPGLGGYPNPRPPDPPPGFGGQEKTLEDPDPRPPDPPPGFGGQTLGKGNGRENKKDKDRYAEDKVMVNGPSDEETRTANDSWPLLTSSPEPTKKNIRDRPADVETEAGPSSLSVVTPPPGYARKNATHTNPPAASAVKNIPSQVTFEAFPPLRPEGNSNVKTLSSTAAPKSVGGSKIFEDIRQALDYDKSKFKEFQSNSGWFRSGVITLSEYDNFCQRIFGPRWADIGPLITKVMPEGKKREELVGLFAERGVRVGPPMKITKPKKHKAVPNAWLEGNRGGVGESVEGTSGTVSGRGEKKQRVKVANRGVTEEEYPSLNVASKLPQHVDKSSSSVWKVSVHS